MQNHFRLMIIVHTRSLHYNSGLFPCIANWQWCTASSVCGFVWLEANYILVQYI